MFFGQNIKLLRKRRKLSQAEVSSVLDIPRSSYSGYENQTVQPPFATLIKISEFYKITIDKLIKYNFETISETQLNDLEQGFDIDVKGDKLRILATTLDSNNDENIELIPEKAKAGYTVGYSDPEYISRLPVFSLPFLSKERKYRAFYISGDSMLPLVDGNIVICEYVVDWNNIKDGESCIVVTKNDGIVLKKVYNQLQQSSSFLLCSTNTIYDPYLVNISSIAEIWKQVAYIGLGELVINRNKEFQDDAIQKLQRQVAVLMAEKF